MSNENENPSVKWTPLSEPTGEPGADDLLDSPAMQPYLNFAIAVMGNKEAGPALAEIAALPLEERYVWRVASALKWAFADSDTLNVEADRKTLSQEDRGRLLDLLKHRPLQFCLFLSALLGQRQMEVLMISAIKNARAVTTPESNPND